MFSKKGRAGDRDGENFKRLIRRTNASKREWRHRIKEHVSERRKFRTMECEKEEKKLEKVIQK